MSKSKEPTDNVPLTETAKSSDDAPVITEEIQKILDDEANLPEGVASFAAWRWRKSL